MPITFFILYALLIAFAIYYGWNYKKIRGRRGEKKVSSILMKLPDDYFLFDDVYLTSATHSSQIDHVVISTRGIFVIETKNMKGWIYGSPNADYWTKNMYGNKYYFYNPMKQNFSHVLALKSVLGVSYDKFIPLVVFLDCATLKSRYYGQVLYASELLDYILGFKNQYFTDEEVKELVTRLSLANNTDEETRKEHVKSVKYIKKYRGRSY